MTDALLFSVNPSMVDMDDARRHLDDHEKLYWSVGFRISKTTKDTFSFPLFGFMHVKGHGQVEYRALVTGIIPFSPEDYENPLVKQEPWRQAWKNNDNNTRSRPWKNQLVMTEIVEFSFNTYLFQKYDGALIKLPPEGYVRVLSPNEASSLASPPQISIAERNLEDFVVQQLDVVETGLRLIERQKSTPAGRLDLLCQDARGNYVVVELKKTRGTDQVVGQLLRYMGWAKGEYPKAKVRGIIIVGKKDDALQYAINAAPDIEAKEFTLSIA
jgi:Endonuclease NucS